MRIIIFFHLIKTTMSSASHSEDKEGKEEKSITSEEVIKLLTKKYISDYNAAQFKEQLLDILKILKYFNANGKSETFFLGGTDDTNQTKFESESIQIKLGVLAKDEVVGYSLITFLKTIIDEHYQYFKWIENINGEEEDEDIDTLGDYIIRSLVESGKIDTELTPIIDGKDTVIENEIWRRSDKGFIAVTQSKKLKEIDIWTVERIEEYIKNTTFVDEMVIPKYHNHL